MNPWLIGVPSAISAMIVTAGFVAHGAMSPQAQLFGRTIRHTNQPRKLALTFDDGPNPAVTPKLLDLLERYEVKATFFVIGQFARQCPDLLRETIARGHSLGNHTETHPNLFKKTPSQIRSELLQCNDAIAKAAQIAPKWFRPPFGMRNPWVIPAAHRLGQQAVMWTLIPGDWMAVSPEWLITRMEPIADRAKHHSESQEHLPSKGSGDILCLHDGDHLTLTGDRSRTLAALEHWLPRWRDLGLEFVTIDGAVDGPGS